MLAAIAVDDEPIALEVIKNLAAKIPFIDLKATFTNAFDAINFLSNEKIDLIFLDIKMPDITGIDFLKSIPNAPMVIFTTAYSEHAVQSFELDVIDYLLKPFSLSRFFKACNKAHGQYELKNKNDNESKNTSVFIKSGYGQTRVKLAEILYAESSGNYVQFVLEDRKILSRLSMSEATDLLPASGFIRIHRSYIAAKEHITKVEKKSVWVKHTELPVGSVYLSVIEKITK